MDKYETFLMVVFVLIFIDAQITKLWLWRKISDNTTDILYARQYSRDMVSTLEKKVGK